MAITAAVGIGIGIKNLSYKKRKYLSLSINGKTSETLMEIVEETQMFQ